MEPSNPLKSMILRGWDQCLTRFVHCQPLDEEQRRMSQLILGFALAGGVFSVLYALFYLAIGHQYGAGIILGNALIFCTLPLFSLRKAKILTAGHFFMLALLLMFLMLSFIEGGVRGHTVAWLAGLPICAMLLVSRIQLAILWSLLSTLVVGAVSFYEVQHVELPMLYRRELHGWVTLVGYVGLGLFLMVLGILSEFYRKQAMQERDTAQEELQKAVEELKQLNEEKNEFLGIAAHDLNNPLGIIHAYAEMIEDSGGEDAEFATEIRESAIRMQTIIRDVLDVNRIESGQYPLNPASLNLAELLKRVVEPYRKPAAEKELQMQEDLRDLTLVADPDALHQVLENLVSNAVKYARPGGRVQISLTPYGPNVELVVFNEGDGFTEEDLRQVFGRFTQLSTRPTGGESSQGLGLSISQKIVTAMGGTIRCESEHGQWARFTVTLPKIPRTD